MLRGFKKLFQIDEQPEIILLKTEISFLGSQGTRTSKDESASYVHCSTRFDL